MPDVIFVLSYLITKNPFYVPYVLFPSVLSLILYTNLFSGQILFVQDGFFSENTFSDILKLMHIHQKTFI